MDHIGNQYRDIYFDDVLEGLSDYCKIETINNPAFISRRRHAAIPSAFTTGVLDVATKLCSRYRHSPDVARATEAMVQRLHGVIDPLVFSPSRIRARIADFFWLKMLYGRLFDRLRPEHVLTADIGDFGMVAAAKERQIRVLELQHGIFPKCHSAYSWTEYAVPYRNRMPLPNALLVYGEYWREELSEGGFWGDGLCAVGSPRLDRYRAQGRAVQVVPTVVWTSQGINVPQAIAFIKAVVRERPPAEEYRLVIKLHPVYDEVHADDYRAAFAAHHGVTVVAGGEDPSTFDLLSSASLHLSVSSTCHYDALGLGVPTVVIPLANHEIVLPLVEQGFAECIADPLELASRLSELTRSSRNVPLEVGEYLYRPQAVANIHAELRRTRPHQ
jgi:hypothetical protein